MGPDGIKNSRRNLEGIKLAQHLREHSGQIYHPALELAVLWPAILLLLVISDALRRISAWLGSQTRPVTFKLSCGVSNGFPYVLGVGLALGLPSAPQPELVCVSQLACFQGF